MKMYFYKVLVADGEQAVALEVVSEILADGVLVEPAALYKQLRVVFEFHDALLLIIKI
jgi:hypothetical protein